MKEFEMTEILLMGYVFSAFILILCYTFCGLSLTSFKGKYGKWNNELFEVKIIKYIGIIVFRESLFILITFFIFQFFLHVFLSLLLTIIIKSFESFLHWRRHCIAYQIPAFIRLAMIFSYCLFDTAVIFVIDVSESLEPLGLPIFYHP